MEKYEALKLDNQVCFPLYALSRKIIKLYKPLLDQHNLTYTQYITMLVVWEEEKIIFKELGHRLQLDSGTLTPVLKKLESMGHIIKYRNEEDDRQVTVELTEKGRALKDAVSDIPYQLYGMFEGHESQLHDLKKILDDVLNTFKD